MDAVEYCNRANFEGNPVSGFTIDSPDTGAFYKHIRINPTTLTLEVWNGSAWVAPGTSTTVYAWKQFRGRNLAGAWIDVSASSTRVLLTGEAGTGIRMNTASFSTGAIFTYHVDTNVVQCRPNSVAYVANSYGNANVPSNNSGTVSHYTDIALAVGKFINYAPDQNYVVYVHPGSYQLGVRLEIPAWISLHLAPDAIINGGGIIALSDGSSIMGNGIINCGVEAVGTVQIEANKLASVIAQGSAQIRANILSSLICLPPVSSAFMVEVDVLEIGDVRTVYGYTIAQLSGVNQLPQPIQLPNSNKSFSGYCECIIALGKWECPSEQQCLMKPYGTKGAGEVSIDPTNYVEAQKSRLLIRANKRITDSVWMLAIGTTVATVEDYISTVSTPHTYITGLYPSSNIDSPEYLTILRLSNQREVCDNGSGYQVAHNSALVLNNVNSKCLDSNVFTNSDSSQNSTPHCATKNCTLSAQYGANISSINSANIRYSTNGTYGDVGRNGGTLINAQADIIVNTSHKWM